MAYYHTVLYLPAAFKPDGTSATTDADLGLTDATLITTLSKSGGIPNLNLNPAQVGSLIDLEVLPETLTREINNQLLSTLGTLYTEVTPVGTTVMVSCADGTNAQFVRINMYATVMWTMVPGTLKNKAGQFIDSTGKVISGPVNHLGLPGFIAALPDFPGIGMSSGDWSFWSPLPGGTVTIGEICDALYDPC
jgi:hypothetical protein